MMSGRRLTRDEIPLLWQIDRSEIIEAVYHLENGTLVLRPERIDARGWPPDAQEQTPVLQACVDHGGWAYALFEAERIIAAAVLENRFIGKHGNRLQLRFLHVGRAHRDQGLGQRLFALAATEAVRRGAQHLYVSATPSQHTIEFYLRLGCTLAIEPDATLVALEPDDIHLDYSLDAQATATTRR